MQDLQSVTAQTGDWTDCTRTVREKHGHPLQRIGATIEVPHRLPPFETNSKPREVTCF